MDNEWIACNALGHWYRVEDRVLMGCAMLKDGRRENNPFQVELLLETDLPIIMGLFPWGFDLSLIEIEKGVSYGRL